MWNIIIYTCNPIIDTSKHIHTRTDSRVIYATPTAP